MVVSPASYPVDRTGGLFSCVSVTMGGWTRIKPAGPASSLGMCKAHGGVIVPGRCPGDYEKKEG
jgi:hypothetical protein